MLSISTIVSFLGAFLAVLIMSIAIKNILFYRSSTSAWRKTDYHFLFIRNILDLTTSIFSFSYYIVLGLDTRLDYSFISATITTTISDSRAYLSVFIAFERCVACLFPVFFYKHRERINLKMVIVAISLIGLAGDYQMFVVCKVRLPVNPDCTTFICAATCCYQTYLTKNMMIYSFLKALLTTILCIKLLQMKLSKNASVTNANIMCLSDGFISITFQNVPTFLDSRKLVNFDGIGPIAGVLRSTGLLLETLIVYILMNRKKRHTERVSKIIS